MHRQDLERMTREQLIAHAERLGIPRPRVLTQPELVDEIIGRTATSERERAKARGWLGRARDLLTKVVEKGLHLPEAVRVLRQEEKTWPAPPPPLPTVTLAEIYAAQGHLERALTVLDEVLTREPDHREARSLRERFVEQLQRSRARSSRVEATPAPAAPTKTSKAKEAAQEIAAEAPTEAPATPPITADASVATEASTSPTEGSAAISEPAAEAVNEAPSEVAVEAAEALSEVAEKEPVEAAEDEREGPVDAKSDEAADVEMDAASALDEPIPSTEPAGLDALESPELPSRYEVDEVVAIAVDPRTIYLYWEVRPTTLARARAAEPAGEMCVRIASVTASWEGPVIDTRDLHVDALYGDRFVRDVQPGSNVRVSVGWKSAAGFEPLAVGAEVTAPRAVPVESVADDVARWDETKVTPFPFSAWSPEPSRDVREVEARVLDPFVARAAPLAPWARPLSFTPAASHGVHGAPIDTGFAIWEEHAAPAEATAERVVVVEEAWFVAGGSSELSRGGPRRVRAIPTASFRPGGASELGR